MAKAKKKAKSNSRPKDSGTIFGLRAWIADLMSRIWIAGRVVTVLAGVALMVAWIVGIGPLRESVGSSRMELVEIDIAWPIAEHRDRSWLFPEVQQELHQMAAARISPDPFDHDSLAEAAHALQSTGWFEDDLLVRRMPDGRVSITGSWRTPAAVVSENGREWLVDMQGVPLRLPPGVSAPTGFFRIYDPASPPPQDASGAVRYAVRWDTDDVRDAIALLWKIVTEIEPASKALIGVDLGEYPRTGRLVLVTDVGCRIVWGGPLGQPRPGEAPVEKRLGQLAQILQPKARQDRGVSRIELYTEYALIAPGAGKNNAAGSSETDSRRNPLP